jgi:iron-sulfur cluster assembly protein
MSTATVETKVEQSPINLSEGAITEIQKIMTEKEVPEDHALRVGVQGGGCSGFSYILGFDVKRENDMEFEINGVKMLMQKSHGIYLAGMQIDYHNDLNNRGFIFNNPNAASTCGCGSSFNA